MKFAIVNGNKIEASKGTKGICPSCGSELISKCGEVKINHWAHKGNRNCDLWWKNETEWHRAWKGNFPIEWQEVVQFDKNGEKHIADVRTKYGLVIEFQYSHIAPQERTSREVFYKNMVWLVDGTRLKRDYPRLLKGKNNLRRTNKQGYFTVDFPEQCFPSSWIESSVPVIFDFLGMEKVKDQNDLRNSLYCLLPKQNKREAILIVFSRESFIKNTINGVWFIKQPEPQKQSPAPLIQNKIAKIRKEATHYYDPKKGRLVKKWRF